MERDEAGLDLVDYVRHTLDNHCTRLVCGPVSQGALSKQASNAKHGSTTTEKNRIGPSRNYAPCSTASSAPTKVQRLQ